MRPSVCYVYHIGCLYKDKSKLFEKILVMINIAEWEVWGKNHIDQDNLSSSQAENCIV